MDNDDSFILKESAEMSRADSNFERFYFFFPLLSSLSQPKRASSVTWPLPVGVLTTLFPSRIRDTSERLKSGLLLQKEEHKSRDEGRLTLWLLPAGELSVLGSGPQLVYAAVGVGPERSESSFLALQTINIWASTGKLCNSARCCGVLSVNSWLTEGTEAGGGVAPAMFAPAEEV